MPRRIHRTVVVTVALLAVAGSLGACGGGTGGARGHTTSSRTVDRGIRGFDFADARWVFWMSEYPTELDSHGMPPAGPAGTGDRVTLHDGTGRATVDGLRATYRLVGRPVFADVDHDGVEEAAVELRRQLGNGLDTAWYVWTWRDGHAVQVLRPVVANTRCAASAPKVTATRAGFHVTGSFYTGSGPCAQGGAGTPIDETVSVRDGYVVSVEPRLGPVEICSPRALTDRYPGGRTVHPRVAPDPKAPPIGKPRAVRGILDGTPEARQSERVGDRVWDLVLLQETSGEQTCAWVDNAELGVVVD